MSPYVLVLTLAVGNFTYQWLFGERDWMTAFEHSYFQAFGIAAYVFFGRKA